MDYLVRATPTGGLLELSADERDELMAREREVATALIGAGTITWARGPSSSSLAVAGSLLAAIGVGPAIADLLHRPTAARHIHNPRWPPHAKFHDAQ